MRFSKAYLGLALLLGASMVASCAEERSVRNTVQPNIVRKTDLTGTWYFKSTVVDVPYGTAASFIGNQGELDKVVWDIQEDILYARRAFEQVNNTDNSLKKGVVGQPVGAWRIQSHFDIIRDYNSATGEESNTIRETGERAWYEREFIRVDWSADLSNNYSAVEAGVTTAPINYYVTDPTSPEALRFERRQVPGQTDATKTEVYYVDVTNKIFLSPETTYYEGYGYIPMCWFIGNADDCTSQEIKIRHSFLKLDPTHEYEPQVWTEKDQERFGYFESTRLTYNRQYGATDTAQVRYANRFNMWVDHYRRGADGKYELDASGNKVRKPEEERTARQLVYWVNDSYPAELKDVGAEIVKGWSLSLWNVANHYNQAGGGAMQILLADGTKVPLGDNDTTPLFLYCADNPPTANSPKGCINAAGGVGKTAREGDIRHSMIIWVDKPQRGGPLGYGPATSDPETGESIRATSYIYGAALDTYSAWARDIVLLLNNELTIAQVTGGQNVDASVRANFEGIRGMDTALAGEGTAQPGNIDLSWAPKANTGGRLPATPKEFNETFVRGQKAMLDSGTVGPGFDRGPARLSVIRNTYLEDMLLSDPEWRMAAADVYARNGLSPFTEVTTLPAEVRRQVSPLTMLSNTTRRMERDRNLFQAHRTMDMAEFGEESAIGLAKAYKSKYDLKTEEGRNNVWKDLRVDIYRGVTEHEMGHNMGLRHNFEGSYDAMNYNKKFWDLRIAANGGNATTLKQRYEVGGAITPAEIDGKQYEYQYSTVMDYGAKFNSDIQGLGKYDMAAIKFAYGDLLEVFNDTRNITKIADISEYQSFGWPTALDQSGGTLKAINYVQFPGLVNLEDRALIHRDAVRTETSGALGFTERDRPGRALVPYRFCSDEFAGGTTTCARYDEGADLYEIGNDMVKRYKSHYIFNAFARNRWGWTGSSYQGRIMGRFLEPLSDQMKSFVRYRTSLEEQVDPAVVRPLFEDTAGWKGWFLSVQGTFNLFGEILTSPEAGSFVRDTHPSGVAYLKQDSDTMGRGEKTIPLIDGHYFSSAWNFDYGYYWYQHMTRIGFAIDKEIVTYLMSETSANYYGADTFSDIRRFSINFYSIYGAQVRNTFSSLISEDLTGLAPIVNMSADGMTPVKFVDLVAGVPARTVTASQAFVDPSVSFTVRYYAQLYGLAMYRKTFDNSFLDESRIFVDGNGEGINIPTAERDIFRDPVGGKTYVAWKPVGRTTVGSRLLSYARLLETNSVGCPVPANTSTACKAKRELTNFLQQIDLQRTLVTMFDKAGDF